MRLSPLAAGLVVVVLAGCGGGNNGVKVGEGHVNTPGSGGHELSVNDDGPIADALEQIRVACEMGNSPTTIGPAIKVLVRETQSDPHGVFESGNADYAQEVKDVARHTAVQLRECKAPAAAAALDRAAHGA